MTFNLHRAAALAALALGLTAGAAHAAHFEFQVGFVTGALAGQSAGGSFVLADADCPGQVCSGLFTPAGAANSGGPTGTLLSFDITVAGTAFTAASDSGYPDFPHITLADDAITGIDLLFDLGLPSLSIFAFALTPGGPLVATGTYNDALGNTSLVGSVTQIPEPAPALLIAGALAAGWSVRRRPAAR